MTASLIAAAAFVLVPLVRSRGQRARRQRVTSQRRRAARERQWRAMIREAGRE